MNNNQDLYKNFDTKNNYFVNYYEIIIALLVSILFYGFVNFLISFVVYDYQNLTAILGSSFIYGIAFIQYIFHIKRSKMKEFSNIGAIIYLSITSLFILLGIIFVSLNASMFASNNSIGSYAYIDVLPLPYNFYVYGVIEILVNVLLYLYKFSNNKKIKFYYSLFTDYKYFKLNKLTFAFLIPLLMAFMYFINDFIGSFYSIENAYVNPNYVFLMFFILIPTFGIIYYFYFLLKDKKNKTNIIFSSIILFINMLFMVIYFVLDGIDSNYMILISKPLFPIDFSASLKIGPILIFAVLFFISGLCIYSIINSSLNLKKETKDNNKTIQDSVIEVSEDKAK